MKISFLEFWFGDISLVKVMIISILKIYVTSMWFDIQFFSITVAQPCLISLLGQLPDQTTSLHSLLLALESQARILLDKIGKSSANGSVPKSGKAEKVDKTTDDKLAK